MLVEYSTRYVSWNGEEQPGPPRYGYTEWEREYRLVVHIDGQSLYALHRENCLSGRTSNLDFESAVKQSLAAQVGRLVTDAILSNLND